jgi:phosphopantothenate-cysteine ligase/phosphopantothenoylcysteine decarboxylase/phosphopantothenate--cysteine ligase
MKILVTAGNTQTPIDKVRCITNVFSGRTGTHIAWEAWQRGHEVCLLTSHPEVVQELSSAGPQDNSRWRVESYRTFDDLRRLMEIEITGRNFDAIVHVAAISDYAVAGTYRLDSSTLFDLGSLTFQWSPHLVQAIGGKVKGNHAELWLRLTPTPKLVDLIRRPWGFDGTLVKFKLEVEVSETRLREIAESSRRQSDADMIVANTLEGMADWAIISNRSGDVVKVPRHALAHEVLRGIENASAGRSNHRASLRMDHVT